MIPIKAHHDGRDEQCVREVIAHYENQTQDEQFAEIEAAHEAENVTLMAVPIDLVPEVRALLARKPGLTARRGRASSSGGYDRQEN